MSAAPSPAHSGDSKPGPPTSSSPPFGRKREASADRLLFGTAGVPESTVGRSTLEGVRRVAEMGLDCLEVEFVQGVKMNLDTAAGIRAEAERLGIALSVHAPYWVNLNSVEPGKRLASQERLVHAARLGRALGARNIVFHAGFYGRSTPEQTFAAIREGLEEVVSILRQERSPVIMRPETMGKRAQFGSLEEVLFLCREVEGLCPCIDFSHLYAREGRANSYPQFHRILTKVAKKLGDRALKDMHIHISGVLFNEKGELKHLNIKESDFRYDDWIQALKHFGVCGLVICESPRQDMDALMLKKLFYPVR
jgi:deoxyribonuclease IV